MGDEGQRCERGKLEVGWAKRGRWREKGGRGSIYRVTTNYRRKEGGRSKIERDRGENLRKRKMTEGREGWKRSEIKIWWFM